MGPHLTAEVKPLLMLQSSASSSSSSSSSRNQNLEKSELIELSTPLNVPSASSNEQSSDNDMHAEQAPAGDVPNRIPSSIFSTQPATPTEWSITSNESLFSIHIGTNSCSKEQFLALFKSGELTKLDEQIIAQGDVLPSLKALTEMAVEENVGKGCSGAKGTPPTVVRTSEVAGDDDGHSHKLKFPAEFHNSSRTRSISGLSDESTFSFAFPVLNDTDDGRLSSVNSRQHNQELKTQYLKQQQEPEPEPCTEEMKPKTPHKASNRSWFSCFRCSKYP
ncbi:hypothetical protein V6N13_021063 [Hibiscus sabdariffa]|uniref:Uncharacterized protein n=1 Tax=Hibiscus sabdariffa TaxID=183260 RepID=A0ABR2EVC3_9ROSI